MLDPNRDSVRDIVINGVRLQLANYRGATVIDTVARELRDDAYGLESIRFVPGDVAIDVGANVGLVTLYLARRHPGLTIHAFEPLPGNYRHLSYNVRLNDCRGVVAHRFAITKDGRDFAMAVHEQDNHGGATGYLRDAQLPGHKQYTVKSTTLDRFFDVYGIGVCRLLKLDCEGAEYEILWNTHCLDRVDYLSGEFHMNSRLARAGYNM